MSAAGDGGIASLRRLGGLLLVCAAAVLVAGCGSQGTLDAKALAKQSEAVQSLAAEGALLAEDSAAGRSTGTYRREHSRELATAASTAAASLEAAKAEPALNADLHTLTKLAAEVGTDLKRLGSASESEQRSLGKALDAAAQRSEDMGEKLA